MVFTMAKKEKIITTAFITMEDKPISSIGLPSFKSIKDKMNIIKNTTIKVIKKPISLFRILKYQ